MPELPEVETVRRALAASLTGAVVKVVRGQRIAMRRPLEPRLLHEVLRGRRFQEASRRGKFLLLPVDGGGCLLIHLGMSGRLRLTRPERLVEAHTHLVVELDDGRELRLVDPRRFGLAVWLAAGEETTDPALADLGIEPFDPALEDRMPRLIRSRRAPVKALLLDQRLVAGIGNIYAAESLWEAGIRPSRPGRAISEGRLCLLARSIRAVLERAITAGGTTLRDFSGPHGDAGYFAVRLRVYGRGGQPCPRCGRSLRDDVIAGRSTVWCPHCQR
ncbi:MAG: bifunctional DNA-formamidopyrimidine glycosylase/DNA-(apurinic or apyrimidinic site) lyase [Acidobacteria bacterium]|nr:bifunctional DNA-formamidopyrimidine glycosylase/DNA-(apurinic or apyrimidinic site) lyase [Acidobacteriota bacterium]